ncbi:toxin-antitoxin system protein [Prevotella nigrescens]|uniref:toxin-antitoxin system protein n=1 Tax=Prevotella nigrescens TaxID=28133 RepID=UPI0028E8C77A|nr:toxin-antitoxin system protein [Prevotella nigrescens]
MEDLNQLLDFGESYPQFVAYHCFGDKATEFLSSLQQPYKDIVTYNIDDLRPLECFAIFVFTDNAEVYVSEIDSFIKQYKGIAGSIFILDLHSNMQYDLFKERWEFYNILTSQDSTVEDDILHYLLFFHHFIETVGLIGMDFNDFRRFARTATYITSGTALSLDQPIYPISYSNNNIRTVMLGLELQSLEADWTKENMDMLASFFEQLPDNVEIIWQITPKYGHPHTEYIVGFDKVPVWHTNNP